MGDKYDLSSAGLSAPAENALAVTPDDGTNLGYYSRALYVGGAGNLKIDTVGGSTVTFVSVPAGTVLPVRAKKVHATGTTATNIVALW
jgi:hypothetical protein